MHNLTRAFSDREPRTLEEVAMLNIKNPALNPEKNGEHLPENRKALRLKHKGSIMLCDGSCEYYSYAQVRNVSDDGMYFESDHGFKRGRIIDIRLDNPPFKTASKYYSATVKWCKPLPLQESILPFGVGVKYL